MHIKSVWSLFYVVRNIRNITDDAIFVYQPTLVECFALMVLQLIRLYVGSTCVRVSLGSMQEGRVQDPQSCPEGSVAWTVSPYFKSGRQAFFKQLVSQEWFVHFLINI